MATFDIIVLVPIAYLAFKGYQNGLVKEVMSIIGIILAVFISINYLPAAQEFVSNTWEFEGNVATLIAGIGLFTATLIITHTIVIFINKVLEAASLSAVNKLFGLAFGGLKAGIFVSLILVLLAGFNMPAKETRDDSITYPLLINLAPASYDVLAKIYPGAEDFTDTINKIIDENNPLNAYKF